MPGFRHYSWRRDIARPRFDARHAHAPAIRSANAAEIAAIVATGDIHEIELIAGHKRKMILASDAYSYHFTIILRYEARMLRLASLRCFLFYMYFEKPTYTASSDK